VSASPSGSDATRCRSILVPACTLAWRLCATGASLRSTTLICTVAVALALPSLALEVIPTAVSQFLRSHADAKMVMLTAANDTRNAERARAAGAHEVLYKPERGKPLADDPLPFKPVGREKLLKPLTQPGRRRPFARAMHDMMRIFVEHGLFGLADVFAFAFDPRCKSHRTTGAWLVKALEKAAFVAG